MADRGQSGESGPGAQGARGPGSQGSRDPGGKRPGGHQGSTRRNMQRGRTFLSCVTADQVRLAHQGRPLQHAISCATAGPVGPARQGRPLQCASALSSSMRRGATDSFRCKARGAAPAPLLKKTCLEVQIAGNVRIRRPNPGVSSQNRPDSDRKSYITGILC